MTGVIGGLHGGGCAENLSYSSPFDQHVAQLYARLGEGIRNGAPVSPGFDAAVTRHLLLDMITRASETGQKQVTAA